MPNTTTATWPSLVAGQVARASDVEAKFDWLEQHLWPMSGGNFTDNTYDLGNTTTAAWRCLYAYSINATSTARGLAIGTTTVASNSDVALEIAGTRVVLLPRLSTVQRDAVGSRAGQFIFNTTTAQLNIHNGTTWSAVGGSVINQILHTLATLSISNTSSSALLHTSTLVGISSVTTSLAYVVGRGIELTVTTGNFASNGTFYVSYDLSSTSVRVHFIGYNVVETVTARLPFSVIEFRP